MGLLAFLVPWDSGERASLMATAVLTLTVFLGLLVEHLPFTDDTPWLAQLVLSLWIYSFVVSEGQGLECPQGEGQRYTLHAAHHTHPIYHSVGISTVLE